MPKKPLSEGKRKIQKLLARDGPLCWLCHQPFANQSGRKPSLDHVVPKSKGGGDNLDNLKLAHTQCNNKRGDQDPVLPRHCEISTRKGRRVVAETLQDAAKLLDPDDAIDQYRQLSGIEYLALQQHGLIVPRTTMNPDGTLN